MFCRHQGYQVWVSDNQLLSGETPNNLYQWTVYSVDTPKLLLQGKFRNFFKSIFASNINYVTSQGDCRFCLYGIAHFFVCSVWSIVSPRNACDTILNIAAATTSESTSFFDPGVHTQRIPLQAFPKPPYFALGNKLP